MKSLTVARLFGLISTAVLVLSLTITAQAWVEDPDDPWLETFDIFISGEIFLNNPPEEWPGPLVVYVVDDCAKGLEDALAWTFAGAMIPGDLVPMGEFVPLAVNPGQWYDFPMFYFLDFSVELGPEITDFYVKVFLTEGWPKPESIEGWSDYSDEWESIHACLRIPEPGEYGGFDFAITFGQSIPGLPGVLYVDPEANGNADGSSWDRAFSSLEQALAHLPALLDDPELGAVSIWMKGGLYPTASGFSVAHDVSILGGFAGDESHPEARQGQPTVLLGLGMADSVVAIEGASVVLDSLTISGGRASRSGGGLRVLNSAVTLLDVTVSSNQSGYAGGGIHLEKSSLSADGLSLAGNRAAFFGGGLCLLDSDATIRNGIFQDNETARLGGAAYHERAGVQYRNCTFYRNSAGIGEGGALSFDRATLAMVSNSILWANTARRNPQIHSVLVRNTSLFDAIVQGGYSVGHHVMRGDPKLNPDLRPLSAEALDNGGLAPFHPIEPLDRWGVTRLGNALGAVAPEPPAGE